ncbi:heparan-alpha-glucosaminide N-acetyltransferase domain-containing protein [Pseudofulvibacter geojedonensis]|uniref:Heparan-alpha-glucosaminide N-acetyltransferase domain-containing protein n=1 Tax=Pseudofulvibacter geojedonensis TaxID=1123758 RepID=A0ABW3I2H0_9FLAO
MTQKKSNNRLVFIDALRSFAIIMMLQGHFVSSLLSCTYKDSNNIYYSVWEYFRGITAPTFFTITGFIFMFLVLNQTDKKKQLLRIKKGIKRGLVLIAWGYILRIGIAGVLSGYIHEAYFYTDVLHIIGLSLLLLCFIYLTLYKRSSNLFQVTLVMITVLSFLFERYYNAIEMPYLPTVISHYFTKANGAVFSLFPWFGYVSIGAFLATLFIKYKDQKNFYFLLPKYTGLLGLLLLFFSTGILLNLGELTQISIFTVSGEYNYLFTRLGDSLVLMTAFIYLRNILNHSIFIQIGKVTLSIYIVHHILLYGSWFHTGLTRWLYNSLTLNQALIGALLFVITTCFLVLKFRTPLNQLAYKCLDFFYRQIRLMKIAYLKAQR